MRRQSIATAVRLRKVGPKVRNAPQLPRFTNFHREKSLNQIVLDLRVVYLCRQSSS
jgi:hypothetical protein